MTAPVYHVYHPIFFKWYSLIRHISNGIHFVAAIRNNNHKSRLSIIIQTYRNKSKQMVGAKPPGYVRRYSCQSLAVLCRQFPDEMYRTPHYMHPTLTVPMYWSRSSLYIEKTCIKYQNKTVLAEKNMSGILGADILIICMRYEHSCIYVDPYKTLSYTGQWAGGL